MLQGLEVDVPNLESKNGNSKEDKLAHDVITTELESAANNLDENNFTPLTTSTPKHIMLAVNNSNGNAESMLIPKQLRATSKFMYIHILYYFEATKIIIKCACNLF